MMSNTDYLSKIELLIYPKLGKSGLKENPTANSKTAVLFILNVMTPT